MRTLTFSILFLLPSCGIYTKLNEAVDRVDIATQKADQALHGVEQGLVMMGEKGEAMAAKVAEIRTAVTEADANKDGRVSGVSEWADLIYQLIAILGIGGYAASTNAKRRQNVAALYTEIDALKDRVRVAELPPVR